MARLSDIIESFIKDMINENGDSQALIQRNELADQFRCAPSQINYVLTTRFTHERGYIIESRRGGGGHILIKQITYNDDNIRNKVIYDAIGDSITYHNAMAMIENLLDTKLITNRESEIMKAAINDRTLGNIENRNRVRAEVLKAMVMQVLI
ncbi:CtsR family transcriptional regulator [Clostridium sp. MSJ-8]|uniref:CtsR family transcriptional regulator n=1 Tax=Clostridium sp. MSJ-8 TaxID=2841510 RepID=UPI001C0EB10D|nr:CtsR family transcriptional regulator [Clostridium sp. MSJ-8]MBU5487209.1 CtsR family transcriptional regulator [Clostridium sp. MSJ-8]